MSELARQAASEVIDLTQLEIKLSLDTIDAVLIVTTGGIGYLARQAYLNYARSASISTQTQNIKNLIKEAEIQGASAIAFRIHVEVPFNVPGGATWEEIRRDGEYKEIVITFSQR